MSPEPPPGYRAHRWVLFAVVALSGAGLLVSFVLQMLPAP